MEKKFEKIYHQLEKSHWWFKSRREVVYNFVKGFENKKVLDIGCSGGQFLELLLSKGALKENLYGIDISQKGVEICLKKGLLNCQVMDATNLNFPIGFFQILIASDCLEHIQNDELALKSWYSATAPGGRIVVFVPAFRFLWSSHDDYNLHFRRYTNSELRKKMEAVGFRVIRSGYWNFFLFFPIVFVRFFKRILAKLGYSPEMDSDLKPVNPLVNFFLLALLKFENHLLKFIDFPFGASTFCIAQKV